MALGVLALVVISGLFFPTIGSGPEAPEKSGARNDASQLSVAIKAFYTEYGRLPEVGAESVPVNRELMAILTGTDHQQNPRKIVFIEVPVAREKKGRWRFGIHPESGAWVDPYGNPYSVKFDTDYDGSIPNPYAGSRGDERNIHQLVIVWSSGQDGIFGNPQKRGERNGSDDILSWQ